MHCTLSTVVTYIVVKEAAATVSKYHHRTRVK